MKSKKTRKLIYKTDSQTLRTNLWLQNVGKGWREGIVKQLGMDMYTLLYLKWITSEDLLYSTGNCLMLCGSLEGGESGGERIHVHLWLSPFAVHLKLSQLC